MTYKLFRTDISICLTLCSIFAYNAIKNIVKWLYVTLVHALNLQVYTLCSINLPAYIIFVLYIGCYIYL